MVAHEAMENSLALRKRTISMFDVFLAQVGYRYCSSHQYTHTPLSRMARFHEFRTGQRGIRDNRSGFSAGEFGIHRNSYGLARYPDYRDPG